MEEDLSFDNDLTDLAKKVLDEVETQGFRRGVQVSPELTREINKMKAKIAAAVGQIMEDERQKGRGNGHPTYKQLVYTGGRKKFVDRHIMAMSPIDPEGKVVLENIESNNADRIQRGILLMNTILRTRSLNRARILKVDKTETPFSSADIYAFYKELKGSGKTGDNLSIAFCKKLGLFDSTEHAQIIIEIKSIMDAAWAFLDLVLKKTNGIISEYAEEDEEIEILAVDDELQTKRLFDWVDIMFDRKRDPKKRHQAQLLLKYALEFYNIHNNPYFKNINRLKRRASEQVQSIFVEDKKEDVLYNKIIFDQDGRIERVIPNKMKTQARTLNPDFIESHPDFSGRVIFDDFDGKKAPSILLKQLTKEPDGDTRASRDLLRCTLTLPDLTLEDYKEPKVKKYAKDILLEAGSKLGLTYVDHANIKKDRPLKTGEFTIEDNTNELTEAFRNLKLLGVARDPDDPTEAGTAIEIQLNTIDLMEISEGKDSPFLHPIYDQRRFAVAADHSLPRSKYKQAHRLLKKAREDMEKKRQTARQGALNYQAQRSSY